MRRGTPDKELRNAGISEWFFQIPADASKVEGRTLNKIAVARRNPIHPTRMSHMLPLFLCFVFYRETG
jgi:hypothetical protein